MTGHLTRRTLAAFALAGAALPRVALAQAPGAAGGLDAVDPELRGPLAHPERMKIPRLREDEIAAFRRAGSPRFPPRLAAPAVVERQAPGRVGAPAVRVFLIDGAGDRRPAPAVLHIHGGGYILGWPESDIANLQRIAADQRCVIVSVDYRLAPETRFPGSLEDNYAALDWLHRNASALGVDPKRIVIMGESAGGGHAAALAIAARDRGVIPLAGQVLVYPMLDDRTGSVRNPPPHQGAYVWSAEQNRLGWSALLGMPAGSDRTPSGAAPARVANLAGLPPTFVGVGGLDLFLQEDVDYARRLMDAGVPTELLVVPGAYHAFQFIVPQAAVSRRFSAAIDTALTRLLNG